ncbi:hypothetical protein QCA50_014126 [Cerrena zonata]|uniref:Uncharacterized protein n=1 Tax=Cerrena zonata TaxID=2478898 RepID=A0AAW0FYM8_9APHY
MGGGARYPYPKEVWSPAGGWWTRPSNWKANTAILFAGILTVTYGAWTVSADREWRYIEPSRPIPSMQVSLNTYHASSRAEIGYTQWAKQYKDRQRSGSSEEEHS